MQTPVATCYANQKDLSLLVRSKKEREEDKLVSLTARNGGLEGGTLLIIL